MITSKGTGESNQGFKQVTGFLKVKDVLINPTLEELQAYGASYVKEEPKYLTEDTNGNRGKGVIITIYFKLDESNFPQEQINKILSHRIWIYQATRTAQSGKIQVVNKLGNFTWVESLDNIPSWFDSNGVREAKIGEEELTGFLKAWGDTRKEDECQIESIAKLIGGDYSELKPLQEQWKTHKLKVLVGLNDRGNNNFNPVIYPKQFWRAYSTNVSIKDADQWKYVPYEEGLKQILNQEHNEFTKADLLTFKPKIWKPEELVSAKPTEDNEFVPTTGASEEEDVF